ncbi:MAG TPA: pirin family protein [Anaerolineales bacterium]|nr:pirin family protein [Anaerolineales bacterium]
MDQPRTIAYLITPTMVSEGAGVRLQRSFGPSRANPLDPFLLFDHFAFNEPIEEALVGFPTHPHRGIETVTYMLEGEVQHKDSLGNTGLIEPGDVQWMTAGGGIMHEEMPRPSPEGKVRGFQLWVNLPASLKMSAPRYQEVKAASIPTVDLAGVRLRVVAGDAVGASGPVTEIAASPLYLDVQIEAGASFNHSIPEGHTAIAYVFEGQGLFGDPAQEVSALTMIVFSDGNDLSVRAAPIAPLRFMLMVGAPFKEPAVPYGPFVMNTDEEIRQALADLRNGTFVK